LKEVIIIEKFLPIEELNLLYGATDLYTQTLEWKGFCLLVTEAMAAQVAVLAHKVQGCGEIVPYQEFLIPSRTGYYIEESYLGEIDVEVRRDKIILAVENPDLMDSYREQGYHLRNFFIRQF